MDANVLIVLLRIVVVLAITVFGVWLLVKLLMGLGLLAGALGRGVAEVGRRIGAFVSGEVGDVVRLAGGVITGAVFVPMVLGNVAIGRWSRANHYGRALEREAVGVGTAAWRIALGHPARLFGLDNLIEGVERRIPDAMARAPGSDTPGRSDRFEGYTITGSLPSGGSGARLFLAEPDDEKRARLSAAGRAAPDRVVIKSFSMADGSSMPQIVRESRALEAARKLGLVIEHELAGTRFHYVMPYVPGEDLHEVTQRLHAESGPEGLGPRQLQQAVAFTADLLATLHAFHAAGLWHKDVKPTNIIVSSGRVQLVDLGLTTPLSSAMTLTTHGTEYFRDPELVRLALRGVKVHEVDGVKFDVYGVGAVLYSLIENSFPAHGSLSQITRRCPEALRWVVRRAMADMSNRYGSTTEMLADVRHVLQSRDPFGVKPAELPSMAGREDVFDALEQELEVATVGVPAGGFDGGEALRAEPDRGIRRRQAAPAAWKEPAGPATTRSGGLGKGLLAAGALVMVFGFMLLLGVFFFRASSIEPVGIPNPRQVPIPSAETYPAPRRASPAAAERSTALGAIDWTERRPEPRVVLLLDDVPEAAGDQTHALIDARLDDLETARFQLVGGDRASDVPEARQIELRAEARLVLELDDPRDDEARKRLSQFVERHADTIDGLLWIGREGDDPDQIAYQFIPTHHEDQIDVSVILEGGTPTHGPRHGNGSNGQAVYSVY